MKILHVGWCPILPVDWREGGSVEYYRGLIQEQVKEGNEVHYFFSGPQLLFSTKPFLKEREENRIFMHAIINSPVLHGGDLGTIRPDLDIQESMSETLFSHVLERVKPDVIHFEEFAGEPSSLIDIAREYRIPTIMTLHDYFLLCPTLKLFNKDNEICSCIECGESCIECCRTNISRNSMTKQEVSYNLKRFHLYNLVSPVYKAIKTRSMTEYGEAIVDKSKAQLYQKRRDINIERLKKIDVLIAQSYGSRKIYEDFLDRHDIIVMHSSPSHVFSIKPEAIKEVKIPIQFVTLNGFASIAKGGQLLLDTIELLNTTGLKDSFCLHVFGYIDDSFKVKINKMNNVIYHGPYKVEELDTLLSGMHIGIVPSVWNEVYGYTGIEMLAKDLPIIGNDRGGISDYVIDGVTGWLNKEVTPQGLFDIMSNIIRNPDSIVRLSESVIKNKDQFLVPMSEYAKQVFSIYENLIGRDVCQIL